jgi:hypothetical protein
VHSATAATGAKAAVRIEWIIECGHQLLRVGAVSTPSQKCNRYAITNELDRMSQPLVAAGKRSPAESYRKKDFPALSRRDGGEAGDDAKNGRHLP